MKEFKIDSSFLSNIQVPNVKFTAYSQSMALLELTTNCGYGRKCLKQYNLKKSLITLIELLGSFLYVIDLPDFRLNFT